MNVSILSLIGSLMLFALTAILVWYNSSLRHAQKQIEKREFGQFQMEVLDEIEQLDIPKTKADALASKLQAAVDWEVRRQVMLVRTEMDNQLVSNEKELSELRRKYEQEKESHQKLGKSKMQTESVLRSVSRGIIILNNDDKVVFMDEAAEKILGMKAADVIGKPIRGIEGVHALSIVNDEGAEDIGIPGGQAQARDLFKESNAVIETSSGQTKGILSSAPQQIRDKKSEEVKKEILGRVNQELRDPIICIQKAITAAKEQGGDPKAENYLDIALRNVTRLEKLVNDMLDLSGLEAGKIKLRYEMITLQPFIEEVRKSFTAWADEKEVEIVTRMPEELHAFSADRARIGQVLFVLISNALKFTPRKGVIELKVKVTGETGPEALVEFSVRDTGPGITDADQQNIFKKFAFASAEPTEGERGAGLGLAIAKKIVEMHKGLIWVESKVGHGSYFAFVIPKNEGTAPVLPKPPSPAA